jgi:hypothetical protein
MYVKGGLGGPVASIASAVYRQEALFFAELADDLPTPRPACYGVVVGETDSLVLMEDLDAPGVRFGRGEMPQSVDLTARMLEVFAELHGQLWASPRLGEHAWLDRCVLDGAVQMFLHQAHWDRYLELRSDIVPPELQDADQVRSALQKMLAIDRATVPTLIHGDAHPDNMYVRSDGTPALLDWQGVQRGSWAVDVTYFLGGALSVEDRRANERDLLRHYLEALASYGVDVPTFDDAWHSYRQHLWHGFMWWLCPLEMQPDATSRAYGQRFATAVMDLDAVSAIG